MSSLNKLLRNRLVFSKNVSSLCSSEALNCILERCKGKWHHFGIAHFTLTHPPLSSLSLNYLLWQCLVSKELDTWMFDVAVRLYCFLGGHDEMYIICLLYNWFFFDNNNNRFEPRNWYSSWSIWYEHEMTFSTGNLSPLPAPRYSRVRLPTYVIIFRRQTICYANTYSWDECVTRSGMWK